MPKCGLLVGSLALSLAEVSSVRQSHGAASAVNVVGEIGELLQGRNMGTEELVQKLSAYASAAMTPGAEGSFAKSLQVVVQDLETKIEKKIRDGQAATQGKLDTLFQGLESANAAANTAKTAAVVADKSWFKCAADEQAKRQTAEHALQSLTDSKSAENEVCQRHQDSTGFKYDGTGKFTLNFACDHSVAGSCEAALKTWEESALEKMLADAGAHMAKEQNSHDTLKASCESKTQAREEAQSTLNLAESAWGSKRAACKTLASQRQTSMCDFGTAAQSKCSAQAEYAKLVTATKKAKGDGDSEVDRESEWVASGATKCMINSAIEKGLYGAAASAPVDEKQCDNWRHGALSDHKTLDECVVQCKQNAKCVACTIGWDLNNYKAMPSCPAVGPRATYGRPSLWQKKADSAADLDACAAKVNFGQDVGKLNLKPSEFDALSKANACTAASITFYNGETWNVPAGDKPSSKSYTRAAFTPQLDPASSNFGFCSSVPPPVAVPPAAPAPALPPAGPCPAGSVQVGSHNADIGGCGLTACDDRYDLSTAEECKARCAGHAQCLAFTWAPRNGDRNHKGMTVCTIYNSKTPTGTFGPNQDFCEMQS